MSDLIDRQAAMDAIKKDPVGRVIAERYNIIGWLEGLPSAQPERRFDEWCTDCKEYDQERNCCPRWNRVIRTTLQEAAKREAEEAAE